jgi:hypothetical protein
MNQGIAVADADLISLLDQDDVMLPTKLSVQSEALERHPVAELALTNYEHIGDFDNGRRNTAREQGGELYSRFVDPEREAVIVSAQQCLNCFAQKPGLPLSCSNQLFRKHMWSRAGGFSEAAGPNADHEFLFRAIRGPIVWIDQILFRKRRHSSNLWKPSFENELTMFKCHYVAVGELGRCSELRAFVVRSARGMAYMRRRRREYGHAIGESIRLLRLGRPGLAIVEACKSSLCMVKAAGGRLLADREVR